jgi:hypothetical protein
MGIDMALVLQKRYTTSTAASWKYYQTDMGRLSIGPSRAAQGIVAEILFCRTAAKKIEADSPVFLHAPATARESVPA